MSKSRLEWKVGLFVFIGLVLLAVLLLQFSKGATFFKQTYNIHLHSQNVGGLKARAQVLMAGVQVGTVSDIRLSPDGRSVTITLRIFSQFVIHKDARFVIEQSGFLGDQYVAILPTKNEGDIFKNGDEAFAEAPFNMQEVARSAAGFLQRIDETAKRLNDAIVDVRRLLLNPETLTNLSEASGNLREFSERALTTLDEFHTLVATNAPAVGSSGSNLMVFSEQMNLFAGKLNGVLATNGPAIDSAVKNIESSTAVLKNLLDDVHAGKGVAGNLLKNDQLAASMAQTVQNLSVTTSNLNRAGLWGILWAQKPPKTPARPARAPLTSPKNPPE